MKEVYFLLHFQLQNQEFLHIVLEMGYATDLHREGLIATAVVLFVFILIINLSFSILSRKAEA